MSADPSTIFYGDHVKVVRFRRAGGTAYVIAWADRPVNDRLFSYDEVMPDGRDGRALAIIVAQELDLAGGRWPLARERLRRQGIAY